MAKRKNLHQYIPEVATWDMFIDLDWRTGDWDIDAAARRAEAMPEKAKSAFQAAIDGLVRECMRYPSCPNLDTALGVIDEARDIGLDAAGAEVQVREEWKRARGAKW